MAIPRFFLNSENIKDSISLKTKIFRMHNEGDIKKIRNVLKLSPKDKVRIFDEHKNEYLCELELVGREEVNGIVLEDIEKSTTKGPHIILANSLAKGQKIDKIVRMNTEIGVEEFVFFESDHSVLKQNKISENKIKRWNRIVLESARQSERISIPTIHEITTFDSALDIQADVKVLLHTSSQETPSTIQNVKNKIKLNSKVLIIIGPEGGFSNQEIEKASAKKDIIITKLDFPILRTETAGIVATSILSY